jgi:hypothetical protein
MDRAIGGQAGSCNLEPVTMAFAWVDSLQACQLQASEPTLVRGQQWGSCLSQEILFRSGPLLVVVDPTRASQVANRQLHTPAVWLRYIPMRVW